MVISFHRKPRFTTILSTALAIMAIAFLGVTSLRAEVEAELDRDSVPAGNGALLVLRISGGSHQQPVIPKVENLIVQAQGQSQQIQIVGGQITKSTTYQYAVGSKTPGNYQIPGITVIIDEKKHSTRPLDLKVLDASVAQPPAGIAPTPPGEEPADEAGPQAGTKRFGFLTVELAANERKHVYVGEIAPVRIRAWLPEASRAQLQSGIQPEGKAFTLHNVSDRPQQTTEIKDGKRYTVVTWFGGISATKAGSYPASLSLNANVAVRDTSARRPRRARGGPFGDPFFDSVFDRMNVPMIQKDVTLKSEDQEIEVRPLPTENRPENFSGAVGIFKLGSTGLPTEWKTGEPQQIRVEFNGSGNFALMDAPEIVPADAWKTYPGMDDFTPGDKASFSGKKRFQFSAVPRMGGDQELALAFSFFNPETAAYVTLTSPKRKIRVSGDDIPELEPATKPSTKVPEKADPQMIAQHLNPSAARSLVPLVSRPAFIPMMTASGLFCICAPLLAWLRVRRSDPERISRLATEKATRDALQSATQCADANDTTGFFAAARLALQQRLGQRWNQPPQAITLAEVRARIPGDSAVVRFFEEADRNEYSHAPEGSFPTQCRTLLDEALASLNPPNTSQ